MKSALGPFVIAIVLTLAGGALWMAGHTETQLADVHKQMATLQYADAQSGGGSVEASMGLERRVPVLGKAVENDARDLRASAGYWRADYAAIAPKHDANGVITETDPGILLLTANAAFRASQAAGDRLDTIRRLDGVVKGYAEVLKAQSAACNGDKACEARGVDAAFNYEYAIRLRDNLAKAKNAPLAKTPAKTAAKADETDLPSGPTLHGRPGAPPAAVDMNQFKIVIPKRGEERKDAPDAGKGGQKIRKG
jgi:hypothetical protein